MNQPVKLTNFGSSGNIANLIRVNENLYFTALDSVYGNELRKIDFNRNLSLVGDLNFGNASTAFESFINSGGNLYFTANTPTFGSELFSVDSNGNPFLVSDINPGAIGSNPQQLTNYNGSLYFSADDGRTGRELWRVDPNINNAVLVADLNPGAIGSNPSNLTYVKERISLNLGGNNPQDFENTLFFNTVDYDAFTTLLWRIDQTANPVFLAQNWLPPITGSSFSQVSYLVSTSRFDSVLYKSDLATSVNGTTYFNSSDGKTGSELWRIDPITGYADLLFDINPGPAGSDPQNLTDVNGVLYFTADDGKTGRELWRIDPINKNPVRVSDINPGLGSSNPESLIYDPNTDTLYFTANDGTSTEVWSVFVNPLSAIDPAKYLASNPDLILAFEGLNYDRALNAARQHYLDFGFNEGRAFNQFNASSYLNSNPDLAIAFGMDLAGLTQHYIQIGFFEGRIDSAQYLASNGDLIGPLAGGSYTQMLDRARVHYNQFGIFEGRSLDSFDEKQYLASNGDLINAFGNNIQAIDAATYSATRHYIELGFSEGRPLDNFDEARYLASNPDLIVTFQYQPFELILDNAIDHYIQFGFNENRSQDSFNATSYLNNNLDLIPAFGNDLNAATKHYIEFGFSEGRIF